MKYPKTPNNDRYVIETMHGCYSESGWCYSNTHKTLSAAVAFAERWGSEYRVFDAETDEVVYEVGL